jgi:toxin CcdB
VFVARFDIYAPRQHFLALDVQANILDDFGFRVVAPLLPRVQVPRPAKDLHPVLTVDGRDFVMATHLVRAVPTRALGRPKANLAHYRDEITRALDTLLIGF